MEKQTKKQHGLKCFKCPKMNLKSTCFFIKVQFKLKVHFALKINVFEIVLCTATELCNKSALKQRFA